MADSARIEDLRKRYHESPRRFFAPLANEYRKSGFLDRAILLCEKHLAEQPDNMNGLVVYGQTLFESGRQDEARAPFERALTLDPENLIALRQLGDIARLGGDVPTAKAWYDKVLEFDRRNDEVLELLEQMGVGEVKEPLSTPSPFATAPLISVASTVSVSGGEGLEIGLVDLDAPKAPVVAPQAPPAKAPNRRASLLDVSFDFGEIVDPPAAAPVPSAPLLGAEAAEYGFADFSTEVSPLAGLEAAEFASEEVAPLADLDTPEFVSEDVGALTGLESIAMAAEPTAQSPWRDSPSQEPPLEPATQPSVSRRPRMTRADLASLPLLADYGLDDDEVVRRGTPLATPAIQEPMPAPEPAPAAGAREPEPRLSQKTPTFATETMATLYLQQGFRDKAMDVYRQLIEQSPHDAALKAKLAELELAVPDMPEFDAPTAELFEPEPAPANALLAEVSFANVGLTTPRPSSSRTPLATPVVASGPTAREFFAAFARRGLVAAVAVAAVSSAAPAAEVAASAEESSAVAGEQPSSTGTGWPLDALFGAADEVRDLHAAEVLAGIATFTGPTGATGLDQLFAEPAAPSIARRTVSRASQMLKFDQFFSSTPASSPEVPVEPEPVIELASVQEPPPADPGDDDLDQFQGWLQALKP